MADITLKKFPPKLQQETNALDEWFLRVLETDKQARSIGTSQDSLPPC